MYCSTPCKQSAPTTRYGVGNCKQQRPHIEASTFNSTITNVFFTSADPTYVALTCGASKKCVTSTLVERQRSTPCLFRLRVLGGANCHRRKAYALVRSNGACMRAFRRSATPRSSFIAQQRSAVLAARLMPRRVACAWRCAECLDLHQSRWAFGLEQCRPTCSSIACRRQVYMAPHRRQQRHTFVFKLSTWGDRGIAAAGREHG